MKRHLIKLIAVTSLITLPFSLALASDGTTNLNFQQLTDELTHTTNLSSKAVEMAFAGYRWAVDHHTVRNPDVLTIVDFSVSSAKNRLYVINLKTGDILMALAVAHGKNSGRGIYATQFGGPLTSRIGVFVTQNSYYGGHGYSLRINGLEDSNKDALARAVVVHSAFYATPEFIKENGRAGNSWGCFAVDPQQSKQLINYIKDGSVFYAYGPSSHYLSTTKILEPVA